MEYIALENLRNKKKEKLNRRRSTAVLKKKSINN